MDGFLSLPVSAVLGGREVAEETELSPLSIVVTNPTATAPQAWAVAYNGFAWKTLKGFTV